MAGDMLYDPSTPEEQEGRDEMLGDYREALVQASAVVGHDLTDAARAQEFLLGTRKWLD